MPKTSESTKIGILMGSDSDMPIMEKASKLLKEFEVGFEINVISAHRAPAVLREYVLSVRDRGIQVIIAGAGLAAHLPGVVASLTPIPVIGVPIASGGLGGQDALFSIVQMPSGVPVATVAINNSTNAAILALQILAYGGSGDLSLQKKLEEFKSKLSQRRP